jgi:hypothetical protein
MAACFLQNPMTRTTTGHSNGIEDADIAITGFHARDNRQDPADGDLKEKTTPCGRILHVLMALSFPQGSMPENQQQAPFVRRTVCPEVRRAPGSHGQRLARGLSSSPAQRAADQNFEPNFRRSMTRNGLATFAPASREALVFIA